MAQNQKRSAADFLPPSRSRAALVEAAGSCQGCDLYKNATQTVFGEGPKAATVIFVGEQPGDREDRAGKPFVGPAGRLFDKALEESRIKREQVYVTNAVKHFKWKPQGKRRKHEKPLMSEIMACRPWLEAEMEMIRPRVVVCLGATAAHSVFKKRLPVRRLRGKFTPSEWSRETFVTIHPSSIYRVPEENEREKEYRRFVGDMKLVQQKIAEQETESSGSSRRKARR
ncbi:MAG TPA: UdgX family uracil-DNA binding protein [Terriglobales bacterium]|nr:UdgX family uracil-DNA binding protein [Terriglobales bacterium]